MEIVIRILTTLGQVAGIIALFSAMEMILYGVVSVVISVIEAIHERSIKTLFETWNDAQDYLMVSSWRIMAVSTCIAMILWLIICAIS